MIIRIIINNHTEQCKDLVEYGLDAWSIWCRENKDNKMVIIIKTLFIFPLINMHDLRIRQDNELGQ